MAIIPILWSLWAAVAFVLAAACGLMWLIERREAIGLTFVVLGVAAGVAAYIELAMMYSATPVEFGDWHRWYQLPNFLFFIGQLLFVQYYLGLGRFWLMWAVILARSVILIVNFLVRPSFHFSEIVSLNKVTLLGDQLSVIGAAVQRSEWQMFANASLVLFVAYLADAAAQGLQKEGRQGIRKAAVIGLGFAVPLLCTLLYSLPWLYGMRPGPLTNVFWWLGTLSTMAYELGRDAIVNRRARLELAEIRGQLWQLERVSILGQLASSLVHELGQPLNAISYNVEAARTRLEGNRPDLNELRSIVDDIGRDDRQALEMILRMRQLFQQRIIQMRPLRVEDVTQDVLRLVRSEASSQHVALDFQMQPGLPSVLGDRVHLSQVLLNLIVNSIQALQSCPPEDRHVVVEARDDEVNGKVEFVVQESGPGIARASVDEIFKPFFTTKSGGMGTGLALSRTIIEAHGGNLWIDTKALKKGAVFRFTLQRA